MRLKNKFLNARNIGLMASIVIGGVGIAFFLLPINNCDDPFAPQLKILSDRAGLGDITAILALYEYNKSKGIKPLEEYWALEGALQGDIRLRREYVNIFKTRLNAEEKKQIIEVVKGQGKMQGAACLMFYLTEAKDRQAVCAQ
jgi:hypothetical protein